MHSEISDFDTTYEYLILICIQPHCGCYIHISKISPKGALDLFSDGIWQPFFCQNAKLIKSMQTSVSLNPIRKALSLPKVNTHKVAGVVAGIASVTAFMCSAIDHPTARAIMFAAILFAVASGITYVSKEGGKA